MKKEVKRKVLPMKNHEMTKAYGNGGIIPHILSVTWIGGWVDPKRGLDAAAKRRKQR
jgi:hypothetical protein